MLFNRSRKASRTNSFSPRLEMLEERSLLDTFLWTGASALTRNWSDANNWDLLRVPRPGDDVNFTAQSTGDSRQDLNFAGPLASLRLEGYAGTLRLARPLTVAQTFAQWSGTITDDSPTPCGGLTVLNGSGTSYWGGGTIRNCGVTVRSTNPNAPFFLMGLGVGGPTLDASTLTNDPGSYVYWVLGDVTVQNTSRIYNAGTFGITVQEAPATMGNGAESPWTFENNSLVLVSGFPAQLRAVRYWDGPEITFIGDTRHGETYVLSDLTVRGRAGAPETYIQTKNSILYAAGGALLIQGHVLLFGHTYLYPISSMEVQGNLTGAGVRDAPGTFTNVGNTLRVTGDLTLEAIFDGYTMYLGEEQPGRQTRVFVGGRFTNGGEVYCIGDFIPPTGALPLYGVYIQAGNRFHNGGQFNGPAYLDANVFNNGSIDTQSRGNITVNGTFQQGEPNQIPRFFETRTQTRTIFVWNEVRVHEWRILIGTGELRTPNRLRLLDGGGRLEVRGGRARVSQGVDVEQFASATGFGLVTGYDPLQPDLILVPTTYLNRGEIAPEGVLTLNGTYTQTATGVLRVRFTQTGSPDQVAVTGNASLAGSLKVRHSFPEPTVQVRSAVLTAASLSGTVSPIIESDPPPFRGSFSRETDATTLYLIFTPF